MPAKRRKVSSDAKTSMISVPLSAVAARKLALASSSAAPVVSASSTRAPADPTTTNAAGSTSTARVTNAQSSTKTSLAVEESVDDSAPPPRKKIRAAKSASTGKAERYWAASGANATALASDGEANGGSEPASEQESARSANDLPRVAPTRNRRERKVVIDEHCRSHFEAVEGVNWHRTQVIFSGHVTPAELFLLRNDESLIFFGSWRMSVLAGAVNFNDAQLDTSDVTDLRQSVADTYTLDCFAPSSHPLPVIVPIKKDAWDAELTLHSGATVNLAGFAAAVIVASSQSAIEPIEKVMLAADIGTASGMWTSTSDANTWRVVTTPEPSLVAYRSSREWSQLVEGLASKCKDGARPVVLVEGTKRSGKSTFVRQLLNQLIAACGHALLLDTDLGQPELTAPGFVSLACVSKPLLGPSFTHPMASLEAQYIGDTSPSRDPSIYLEAVKQLANLSAADDKTLVVNTQGWVKGLGADLLVAIKNLVQPTHIVRLDADGDVGIVDHPHPHELVRIAPAPATPLESRWTAMDLRTLQIVSHAYAQMPRGGVACTWDFPKALVQQIPYAVDWRDRSKLAAIHIVGDDVQYEHALYALNGALVALFATSANPVATTDALDLPYVPGTKVPDVGDRAFLGVAVIRSVDPEKHALYLCTPVHPDKLASSGPLVIVKGAIALPIPLMLDHNASEEDREKGVCGFDWADVPYLSVEPGPIGRRRVRRNVMRRSQQG